MGGGVDFRRVFDEGREARMLLDPEGRVLSVSDGYLRTTGSPRAVVTGRSVFDSPPFTDYPGAAEALHKALATLRAESVHTTPVLLPEEVTRGAPWSRGDLRAVRTEDERLEYAVLALEQGEGRTSRAGSDERRLSKLSELLDHAVVLFDANFRAVYVSPAVHRVLGLTEQEFVESNSMARVHPDDRSRLVEEMRRLLEKPGNRMITHYRALHKDGTWRMMENAVVNRLSDPDVAAVVYTLRDVTERMTMQEELRRSGERLRVALAAARAMSWEVNLDVGRVEYSGDCAEFFGVAPGPDYGDASIALVTIHPEDRERFAAAWTHAAQTGQALTAEFRGNSQAGPQRHFASHGMLVHEPGQPRRLVGVTWDVTERKQFEQRMQESQKLESLGVLAGGIAHDFNNLLMVMLGNLSLVRTELTPPHPVLDHLDHVEEAARRATELCRQLLAYAGKGRFVLQRTRLNQLIDETTNLLRVSISKKATLRFHLDPNLPAIVADATQMRQVLMNLVINASDALGDRDGIIAISTGVVHADRSYLESAFLAPDIPQGDYVFLEVSDTGEGMTPETQSRIFEPFFTTKFTGRGLGLAAVLGIVRGHKGALKVYSEVGRGSSFKFLLPVADGAPSSESVPAPAGHESTASGTILVVDDEEPVRLVASKLLTRMGFHTLLAADGDEAIRVYRESQDRITCVLMDLTMPRLDGEETFRELRRIDPKACVMLMSGYNEQDAIGRFVGKGIAGFIQKPFSLSDLEQRLRALISAKRR